MEKMREKSAELSMTNQALAMQASPSVMSPFSTMRDYQQTVGRNSNGNNNGSMATYNLLWQQQLMQAALQANAEKIQQVTCNLLC